jgi:competence protein ComEC
MILQNPMILRFDIGFQLSFLAVVGMAYFSQPIVFKLLFIPEIIREPLSVALAAQIFTLPILVYNFGYISIYSLFANILVEPLVSFITIYGFILAFAASINLLFGWILFFPMWLALSYLLFMAGFFSNLPYASVNFEINFFWLLLSYLILIIIAWYIHQKQKLRFLNY